MTRKFKVKAGVIDYAQLALEAARNPGGFIRVRGAAVGDPLHEFDIPVALFEAHPDRYTVVDSVPRAASRPMKTVDGVNAPDSTTDAPSEGDPEKENDYGI